jgi:hypothetical protein
MLRLLQVLAIPAVMAVVTPLPVTAQTGDGPSAPAAFNAVMSDLSAAKQTRAHKHRANKRHVNKRYAGKRHYKRHYRMSQPAWRPGAFRSDPSFDPYGRPWRPNFYSNCYEDLGYGRFRACDVF